MSQSRIAYDQLRSLASLARLECDDAFLARHQGSLENILHWIDVLNEVPCDGIEAWTQVGELTLSRREDAITDGGSLHAVLMNAPDVGFDMFAVPKVIE
jgi:aspartyl-tRNA(Asn)/glutamyl-tRNA(Gln) amidotransferase subunit C